MRRAAVALAAISLLAAVDGCGLEPFGTVSAPPVEGTGARITRGSGSTAAYSEAVQVVAGNVVQFRATLADGETAFVSVPRGPARELIADVRPDGSDAAVRIAALRSRNGAPLSLGEAFSYDPSYVGIEHHTDGGRIAMRLAVPGLAGTGRKQVTFTFKVPVR